MTIQALPPAPSRSTTPSAFAATADAFVAALQQFGIDANATAAQVNTDAGTASAGAATAASAASTATAAAVAAVSGSSATGTSTTSMLIGFGAKTITIQTGKSFVPGQFVQVVRTSDVTTYNLGQISAYNPATGVLTFTSTISNGSGTYTDWTVFLSPPPSQGILQTYTWAGKPLAAASSGQRIRISDAGVSPGLVVVSDGTRWICDGVQVLAQSAVAVSGAADTNENALATITIPADLLGPSGMLRLRSALTWTNSANNKTLRIRFSGAAGTILYTSTVTTGGGEVVYVGHMANIATNSQVFRGVSEGSTTQNSGGTSTVDTTATTTLLITAQKVTGSETVTLNRFSLEILP